MKTVWKIFQLTEMSVRDEWEGEGRSGHVLQEWFSNHEIHSEEQAWDLLKAAEDEIRETREKTNNGEVWFEVKKVTVF